MLSVEDLLQTIHIEGYNLNINMLATETGELSLNNSLLFSQTSTISQRGNGILFVTNGYTFSIIWGKQYFFLFDSRSRSKDGLFLADGKSVLLQLGSLKQTRNYITEVYDKLPSKWYQMQYVKIEISESNKASILSSVRKAQHL